MQFGFSAGIVVYTYVDGERAFLMLKRTQGWLDLPKGHIEKGEDSRSAAIRETEEETGLRLSTDLYFKDEVSYWYNKNSEKIKKMNIFYLAKLPANAKIRISYEHEGYEWVKMDGNTKLKIYDNWKEMLKRASHYIDMIERMGKVNGEYALLPSTQKGWQLSSNFVPGEGPLNAKIMVIGQAPGRFEDEQHRPFVGMAGKLLDNLLRKAGLRREKVYITSIVQFFPPENRVPTDEEAEICMPYLKRQIEIIKPKIIVLLGNFAAKNVAGIEEVMRNHGKLIKSREYGCYLYITVHPAAAVRIKKNTPILEEDFTNLKELIKDY